MNKCPLEIAINQNLTTIEQSFKLIRKSNEKVKDCIIIGERINEIKCKLLDALNRDECFICSDIDCTLNLRKDD